MFFKEPSNALVITFKEDTTQDATDIAQYRARFLNLQGAQELIPSKEPIPPSCVAWRDGTTTIFILGS
jgi:hypothetical protein